MMTTTTHDLIVQLPTAEGKSLLIESSGFLNRDQITLIVVPYVSLREDLRKQHAQRGLQSMTLINDASEEKTMVFTTPEQLISESCSDWVRLTIQPNESYESFRRMPHHCNRQGLATSQVANVGSIQ